MMELNTNIDKAIKETFTISGIRRIEVCTVIHVTTECEEELDREIVYDAEKKLIRMFPGVTFDFHCIQRANAGNQQAVSDSQ